MQVKKQQLELDMEQTGSKSRKEYIKAVYCHSAYLTYMQSASWKMLGWKKHKLESILPLINNLRYAHDTTFMAENEVILKHLLMKLKEESEKVGLQFNVEKPRSWHLIPSVNDT